jgi:serine/threonine protein phosphatase PrpC
VQIDAARVHVDPGDLLMLCSDGLSTEVSDEELEPLMLSTQTPSAMVDALVDLALSKGGNDNVSVVVAKVCA